MTCPRYTAFVACLVAAAAVAILPGRDEPRSASAAAPAGPGPLRLPVGRACEVHLALGTGGPPGQPGIELRSESAAAGSGTAVAYRRMGTIQGTLHAADDEWLVIRRADSPMTEEWIPRDKVLLVQVWQR